MQGSPFQSLVKPAAAHASSSRLYGPGLQAIQLGKPAAMFLQLADEWGNAVEEPNLASLGIKVRIASVIMIAPCCRIRIAMRRQVL